MEFGIEIILVKCVLLTLLTSSFCHFFPEIPSFINLNTNKNKLLQNNIQNSTILNNHTHNNSSYILTNNSITLEDINHDALPMATYNPNEYEIEKVLKCICAKAKHDYSIDDNSDYHDMITKNSKELVCNNIEFDMKIKIKKV